MLVVADSSSLVALATCNALGLLIELYEDVRIPNAVYDEVTVVDKPQARTLKDFLDSRITDIKIDRFVLAAAGLGQGEIEAMALYKALSADYLLIDDRRARAFAEANVIRRIGSLSVLLLAKHYGLIESLTAHIILLRESSLHYSEALLDKVIQLAGE